MKKFLGGADLSDMTFHRNGAPAWLINRFKIAPGTKAVTFGNDIYFTSGFDPDSAKGLGLIAHEIVHTMQYEQLGRTGFLARYNAEYQAGLERGLTPQQAYRSISFEVAGPS